MINSFLKQTQFALIDILQNQHIMAQGKSQPQITEQEK